ncbi:MAG TPA: hypothetical protein VHD35_01090 [Chitinophagaceae bacterium]|nr:hypothetical protein [Chitinophagaceae bacterium]
MKIRFSEFKKNDIKIKDSPIEIYTPLFNEDIILPIGFCGIGIWMFFHSYTLLTYSIFIFLVGFYVLWRVYSAINVIKIDIQKEQFVIFSRNPIKFMFLGKTKILFGDVKNFSVEEYSNFGTKEHRFIVIAILDDSSKVAFTQSQSKIRAGNISKFLNSILATNVKNFQ